MQQLTNEELTLVVLRFGESAKLVIDHLDRFSDDDDLCHDIVAVLELKNMGYTIGLYNVYHNDVVAYTYSDMKLFLQGLK